ncbi:MAG: septum formation inhibitor Maf [Firmicutes bacterium]|nr:septum formation inhibitor Maf [Bacillota bacterium]
MEIILASQSPRRAALLRQYGLDFTIESSPAEESSEGNRAELAVQNALRKAEAIAQKYPQALTIGADTIVVLGERVLGKPSGQHEAYAMLRSLSGQVHQVITGVALVGPDKTRTFAETTSVKFRDLSDDEIGAYVRSGEPLDKAGAYGIQGFGGLFVEAIHGCYFNVVGLPTPRLMLALREFGIDVFR